MSSLQCVVTVNTALGPQVEVQYTVYSEVGTGGYRRVQVGAGRDGRLHHRAHLSVPGTRVTGDSSLFKDTGHGCQ